MTVADFRTAASKNLVATYSGLALASPNTQPWKMAALEGCLGDFDHPICNFAVTNRVLLDDLAPLREVAASRRCFHIYVLPGQDSDAADETLRRGGFRELYTLVEMVGPRPARNQNQYRRNVQPALAEDRCERHRVGRFMADQFFPRQAVEYREAIADATADATDLQLYSLHPQGQESEMALAGIMLSRTSAPAGSSRREASTLGIYNLCVEPMSQGTGIGRGLVGWAVDQALAEDRIATLQCDPRLASWYEELGFWQTGFVRAYGL